MYIYAANCTRKRKKNDGKSYKKSKKCKTDKKKIKKKFKKKLKTQKIIYRW